VTDSEIALLALLLRRPRSRLKTYARMRKRDRLFAAWAQSDPLAGMTQAVRFTLDEPLLEASAEERAELDPSWSVLASRAAREVMPHYEPFTRGTALAREDALVRIATKVAIDVFGGLGLVMLWEWVTQRDARVCDKCGPLDGKVMASHLVAPLPLHPRCRCGLRPVVQQVALVRAG
jgi:ribosomal protein S27AE